MRLKALALLAGVLFGFGAVRDTINIVDPGSAVPSVVIQAGHGVVGPGARAARR
jgi:hypothetical protein